jgi:acyl dehydratase
MSFTDQHLFYNDVEVGQEWTSPGRTITETDIVNFAGVSGDFNPIHVDHEFARGTIFRRPIAHGLLVWAVSSGLTVNSPTMRTLAFASVKDWSFKEPVFIGDTVRVRTKILAIEPRSRGRRASVTWQREIVNQQNKVVQAGVLVTIVEGRAAVRSDHGTSAPEEADSPA